MIRIRTAAFGAAMIIGVSVSTHAQQRPKSDAESGTVGMRRADAKPQRMLFRDIDLSEAQRTQVRAIREKYEVQARAVRDSSRDVSQQGDTAQARGARKASKRGRQYSGEITQKAHSEIRSVLTAEQQPIFDRNVAEMKKKHEQKSKRAGKRGGRSKR